MSTHASITAQLSDGSFKSVYVHSDGYVDHTGKMLAEHYSTQEKVDALMAHGDISTVYEHCDKPEGHTYETPAKGRTVYYGRDRGEDNVAGSKGATAAVARFNGPGKQSYNYVWDGERWTVGKNDLIEVLAGEDAESSVGE